MRIDSLVLPEGVIFDWDNTLVDNWGAITLAVNAARAAFDFEPWTIETARDQCTRALRDSFPEWFGSDWGKARDIFYDVIFKEHIRQLKVLPGADDLLAFLESKKIPTFVVSNKKSVVLHDEVRHLGWEKRLKAVVGSVEAPRDKPHPAPVDMALQKYPELKCNHNVWFVGDTYADVECSLRAGCLPVLVHNKAEADRLGVKLFFYDCQELKTTLYNLSK